MFQEIFCHALRAHTHTRICSIKTAPSWCKWDKPKTLSTDSYARFFCLSVASFNQFLLFVRSFCCCCCCFVSLWINKNNKRKAIPFDLFVHRYHHPRKRWARLDSIVLWYVQAEQSLAHSLCSHMLRILLIASSRIACWLRKRFKFISISRLKI